MHTTAIEARVSSPDGSSNIEIPRKGRNLYGFSYEQTNAKGAYTFTILESRGYAIKESSQSVTVLPSKNTSPIMFIGIALGVVLLGCGVTTPILLKRGVFQKLIKPKPRKTDTAIEAVENIEKRISQEISEEMPVPNDEMEATDSELDEEVAVNNKEITLTEPNVVEVALLDDIPSHFPNNIVCHSEDNVIQLSFQKKEDVIFGRHFFLADVESGQIDVNDKMISEGEEAKILNKDIIKIGELAFRVLIEEDNVQLLLDDTPRESLNVEEEIDEDGLIRWNIKY